MNQPSASPSPLVGPPPLLFFDRGCPFAHRVLALLEHLGLATDRRMSRVGNKPDGLEHYSPSGRIPLLVHTGLVLTESRVMLEHLAEYYGFVDAYPASLGIRSLHRNAMAVVDDCLVPLLMGRGHAESDEPRLDEALSSLEKATAPVAPRPCLLTFQVTPIWGAFRSWQPSGAVTRAIETRAGLRGWLDAAARLDCLARTAPDSATLAEDIAGARTLGLLPSGAR